MQTEPEKFCKKCEEWWPADTEFFFRHAKRADGLSSNCKACFRDTPSNRARASTNGGSMSSPWERLFRPDEARAS